MVTVSTEFQRPVLETAFQTKGTARAKTRQAVTDGVGDGLSLEPTFGVFCASSFLLRMAQHPGWRGVASG